MTNVNDAGDFVGVPEPDNLERLDPDDSNEDIDDGPQEPPSPYVYEMSHAGTAVGFLAQAAQDTAHLRDLGNAPDVAATAAGLDAKDPLYLTLQSFARYRLKVDRGDGGPGAALEPLRDDGQGWYWPQPIRTVSGDVKRLWSDIAAAASDVIISARAHDLCFAGQVGNGRLHAVAAGEAYLRWPTTKLEPLDVALGLVRAWTLGRAVGDSALEQKAYDEIAGYARAELDNGGNPGTVLPMLETLTTPPRKAAGIPSATVDAMVAGARVLYEPSYLRVRLAAMMRRTALDDAGREKANRAEVQAHLDEAGKAAEPFVRMHHLQAAAAAAKRFNVKDLEAIAVSGLQAISVDELGLQRIVTSSSLPAYIPESFLRQFDEAHDWREAIHRFLHTDSPTGSYEKNLNAARRSLERPSLRHLFGGVRIGAHGLPQQSFNADDERLQQELVQFEELGASLYGFWYADGLERIAAAFGSPAKDEITTFLVEAYSADPRLAKTFATALRLFWQEEFDASVHLAVPVVEASARALLLELNEPLYRVEQGSTIGQFPGLGFLLPQLLKSGFDPDWERFLGTLLLPRGENIRNLVAHGFVHDIRRSTAALVLRAAGLMALVAPGDRAEEDKEVVREWLRDPLRLLELYERKHPVRALVARARRAATRIIAELRRRRV